MVITESVRFGPGVYVRPRGITIGADGTEVTEDMRYSRRGDYFNYEVHGMHSGEFVNYAEYFAQSLLAGRDFGDVPRDGSH